MHTIARWRTVLLNDKRTLTKSKKFSVKSAGTSLLEGIMEYILVMAVVDFSCEVFDETWYIPAKETVHAQSTRRDEISVRHVDLKNVSM